jgi:hypothetical protein
MRGRPGSCCRPLRPASHDAGNAITAKLTTVTTPEGRCKPEPSPEPQSKVAEALYRFAFPCSPVAWLALTRKPDLRDGYVLDFPQQYAGGAAALLTWRPTKSIGNAR